MTSRKTVLNAETKKCISSKYSEATYCTQISTDYQGLPVFGTVFGYCSSHVPLDNEYKNWLL